MLQQREQADLKLWERVQLIVDLAERLRSTNADEAAYHGLVQTILEGTPLNQYSSDLVVKIVTSSKLNRRHLPQETNIISRQQEPLFNSKVDVSLEHAIPTRNKDFSLLPYSLLVGLKRAFGPTWNIGPYRDISLVSCVAEVRTPYSPSPHAEAELQAAVGGVCMIVGRHKLIAQLLSLAVATPKSLLALSFPVLTLVVLGDTWYFQIVYYSAQNCCVVLPARLAGECATHQGTFRLLAFVDSLRDWCRKVYCKEYTGILRALGSAPQVGWEEAAL